MWIRNSTSFRESSGPLTATLRPVGKKENYLTQRGNDAEIKKATPLEHGGVGFFFQKHRKHEIFEDQKEERSINWGRRSGWKGKKRVCQGVGPGPKKAESTRRKKLGGGFMEPVGTERKKVIHALRREQSNNGTNERKGPRVGPRAREGGRQNLAGRRAAANTPRNWERHRHPGSR